MTDGTSQGLFIVVAIVIFGIFVVMAYILFEDTLSPALASMFSEATEQANKRVNNMKKLNNTILESPNQHHGHIVFDFSRKYEDTGEDFNTIFGEYGVKKDNLYVVDTKRVFYGRITEFEDFIRIHVAQSWTSFETYKFNNIEVFVNGNKEGIRVSVGKNPSANVAVHYLEFLESPTIIKGKPYTFKVLLHTDNKEYFEIEKKVVFK